MAGIGCETVLGGSGLHRLGASSKRVGTRFHCIVKVINMDTRRRMGSQRGEQLT